MKLGMDIVLWHGDIGNLNNTIMKNVRICDVGSYLPVVFHLTFGMLNVFGYSKNSVLYKMNHYDGLAKSLFILSFCNEFSVPYVANLRKV
jgi:hypothetical protein